MIIYTDLQNKLLCVLLRGRFNTMVMTGDIQEAFLYVGDLTSGLTIVIKPRN